LCRYDGGRHFGRSDAHFLLYEAGPALDRRRLGSATVEHPTRCSPAAQVTANGVGISNGSALLADALDVTAQTAGAAAAPQTASPTRASLPPPPTPPADWPSSRAMLVPALVRRRARVELRRPLASPQSLGSSASLDLSRVTLSAAGAPRVFGEVQDFDSGTGHFLVRIDGSNTKAEDGSSTSSLVSVRPVDLKPFSPTCCE